MSKVRRVPARLKRRGLGHIDEEVGARVRQYRLRKGLSQTTLADAIGVTFQQIQKYEKGTNAIATARLPMLCDVLGITPNDLYGDLFMNRRQQTAGTAIGHRHRQGRDHDGQDFSTCEIQHL